MTELHPTEDDTEFCTRYRILRGGKKVAKGGTRTNQQEQRDETKHKEKKNEAHWCDAGMYSGMTITMYINYAHVAQQYFLLRFTKYVVNY